jgi:organic hydroperoxide reductase OsmC/OhrA
MNALYTTKVAATGIRHGHIRSEDGLLSPCENSRREIDS